MTALGVICARYHSKGLPGKNWTPMCGTPLIEYAIEKAYETTMLDEIVVSTDIPKAVWSRAGVRNIGRPDELAGDAVGKWDVWRWIAEQEPGHDMLVDIDVTRPLTLAEDIDACAESLAAKMEHATEIVMAIAEGDKHPAFDIVEHHGYGVQPYVKTLAVTRQELQPTFYHGGVYAVTTDALKLRSGIWDCLVKGHVIPLDRARDIDTETDWKIVEMLMQERMGAHAHA